MDRPLGPTFQAIYARWLAADQEKAMGSHRWWPQSWRLLVASSQQLPDGKHENI